MSSPNTNLEAEKSATTRENSQRKTRPFFKVFFIGCGTIVALVAGVAIWVGVTLFSGQDAMELSEFHPFRSQEAKEKYLTLYDERAAQWPVPSEEKTIPTSYGQTFVRVSGPIDGAPLVLLPGGGASSLSWILNIEALSQEYRTFAVDNIYDFGRSVYTREMSGSEDYVIWLDELLGGLKLEDDVNLLGLSYGGWLTSEYAIHNPDRLNKVVLLAPAATVVPFSPEFLKRALPAIMPNRTFLKNFIDWLLADLANKDEDSRQLLEQAVDDLLVAKQCFKFKMLPSPRVLKDEELASIKVPVLFLVGENEKIYNAEEAVARLNRISPQIETEILPGCGHDLLIVQKELVNKKVLNFLSQ